MMVNASSKRSMRWSKGKPNASYSVRFHPAPRPRISRPPEISSTVAAFFASIAGAWKEVDATNGPSLTRSVDSASAASIDQASNGPVVPYDPIAVEQVIPEPQRVEACSLRSAGDVPHLEPPDFPLDFGQLDPYLEPMCHPRDATARESLIDQESLNL